MNYNSDGLVMKFPVQELYTKLKINRDNHADIVKEAQEGYVNSLMTELGNKLKRLKEGKKIDPNSKLPIPGDNLEEYDTAIEMLKFTSDDVVSLSQHQFQCYVRDKWDWQKKFLEVASEYSSSGSMYYANNKW